MKVVEASVVVAVVAVETITELKRNPKAQLFLSRVLDPPQYGFERDGKLYKPSYREIFGEFGRRLNLFRSRKNWLPVFSWVMSLSLGIPLVLFFTYYFSWPLALAGFIYSMVILGSHGTFWLHRYGTHRAYQFRNKFCRDICRNLVIRIIPEEVYIISHHVHHQFSEEPGDPYNVNAGWLYCFLADANHQGIRKDLSEKDYLQLCKLMNHTGVRLNSYQAYQKWGSISHPFCSIAHYATSWAFWFGVFYLMGGVPLAVALFGAAGVWAIGVRTFNFEGHGKGTDRRRAGVDFNTSDLSVNQIWPGFVAGEWHSNHHLYPCGARSGFLGYQLDIPWLWIRFFSKINFISSYKDFRAEFIRDHYQPYLESKYMPPSGTAAVMPLPIPMPMALPTVVVARTALEIEV